MANVLKMHGSTNGLSIQLRTVIFEKPVLCNSSCMLKTVKRNFKNSGEKEDYSVNKSASDF
jgi:hypothetical protein